MTIIKKYISKDNIPTYIVRKDLSDEATAKMNGKLLTNRSFDTIINKDADVYTEDGELLLKFRRKVLPEKNVQAFYDAVIDFAHHTTATRGASSGSKVGEKDVMHNKKIMSNIYGYFDKWTIYQKFIFKVLKIKPPSKVRVTRFTTEFPDKWKAMFPYIKDIDNMYKKLVPQSYKVQKACADQTAYKVPGTAFSTITTNINASLGCHVDSNNLKESFGTLAVIERGGKYEGGYTVFPQYRIGVDVRTGDHLSMDIHQLHGVSPIKLLTKDAERLSIVCYLREGIYEKSKGTTPEHVERNIKTMKRLLKKYNVVIGSDKK